MKSAPGLALSCEPEMSLVLTDYILTLVPRAGEQNVLQLIPFFVLA